MRIDKNTIKVHGNTEIKEVNDFFNVRIPGKGTDTVSGLMQKKLKKIPRKGEFVDIGNVRLTIEKASRKTIERVLIIKEMNIGETDQKTKIPF